MDSIYPRWWKALPSDHWQALPTYIHDDRQNDFETVIQSICPYLPCPFWPNLCIRYWGWVEAEQMNIRCAKMFFLAHLNTNYRHFLLFVDEVCLLMYCHMSSTNDQLVCFTVRKGSRPSWRFQQDHLEWNREVENGLGDSGGDDLCEESCWRGPCCSVEYVYIPIPRAKSIQESFCPIREHIKKGHWVHNKHRIAPFPKWCFNQHINNKAIWNG